MQIRRPHGSSRPGAPRGRRAIGLGLLTLGAWSLLVFAIGAASQATGFFGVVVKPLLARNAALPVNFIRGRLTVPTRLEIDMKFDHLRRLEHHRARALAEHALFATEDDYVPATIRTADQEVKVHMRLKGDSAAHLSTDKWSYRVKVRGGDTLLGMKRFSLHHPGARNYLSEWLFHRALLREGVIALRYEFVDVSLNGKGLGIYALEEHFEKRLIESNRRREGPIVRFDEDLMWREAAVQARPFHESEASGAGAFEASSIDGFQTGSALADPDRRVPFLKAIHLLEAFREGELSTSEVFEVDRLATYFALVDLLGAEHGARWHNIRFYYNPITSRLEPIGFDGNCVPTRSIAPLRRTGGMRLATIGPEDRPLNHRLFQDRAFYARYMSELERIAEPAYVEALIGDLADDMERALHVLHREFPHLEAPTDLLRRNRAYIETVLHPVQTLHAHVAEGGAAIEVGNIQSIPVEILAVEWGRGAGAGRLELDPPAVLEPRSPQQLASYRTLDLGRQRPGGGDLEGGRVVHRLLGTRETRSTPLVGYPRSARPGALVDPPRAVPNAHGHDALEVDDSARTIRIRSGRWQIASDLVIPAGYIVEASGPLRIDLVSSARLLSYSPLQLRGTGEAPIEFTSSDGTGEGVIVIQARGPSLLEHVRFERLNASHSDGWALTGAITFYESPVTVRSCRFSGNPAEDSLNIVRSDFTLESSVFEDAPSDGFDCDFCSGRIVDSRFERITNDAVDVSGSTIEIENLIVDGAGDKGISAGERSTVRALHLSLSNVEVGIASKDSSFVHARDVHMDGFEFALAAYQKKPEFGPGRLEVVRLDHSGELRTLIEPGSRASLDGRELPVDGTANARELLYETPADPS